MLTDIRCWEIYVPVLPETYGDYFDGVAVAFAMYHDYVTIEQFRERAEPLIRHLTKNAKGQVRWRYDTVDAGIHCKEWGAEVIVGFDDPADARRFAVWVKMNS
jgi:hypothetical protein